MILCGPIFGIATAGVRIAIPRHGRVRPHRHRNQGTAGEVFGPAYRPVLVIPVPGLDPRINPGIPPHSVAPGDPRIKSGDDGDLYPNRYLGIYRTITRVAKSASTPVGARWQTI
jgi:hypothetical protein